MISKASHNKRYECKNDARIFVIFLALVAVAVLVLLRWAGFQWRHAVNASIPCPRISSIPYFNTPATTPTPTVQAHEVVSDVVADLPALPYRPERKQQALRDSIQVYLVAMQQTESRKRVLLHALFQLSPDLRRLVEQRMPESPAETDLDQQAVNGNRFDDKRETEFPLRSLPTDEWDRIIESFGQSDPPPGCRELHEAYSTHLKTLRDLTLQRLTDERSSSESASEHSEKVLPESEQLQATTRVADAMLAGLCAQFGLSKDFDITLDEQ